MFKVEIQTLGKGHEPREDLAVRCSSLPFVFGCQSARPAAWRARRAGTRGPGFTFGGADRSRTDDIQLAKLALYQLSYSPIKRHRRNWWA
jgi:hypothetical protein